ncbi:MAG: ferritin family protein [Acidobacteriota bacterium]|nr:ferritin family protein [Acidobacteriota bacterium]
MSVDIDFANLSIKDALDLAILVEEEVRDRYQELADNLEVYNTGDAAQFFRFMVGCEAKHGEELLRKRAELFGTESTSVDGSMLWDVEAPGYEVARTFMTLQDALQVSLAAETKAYEFFDGALPEVKDPEVRELFAELRQEEVEHMEMVREQMKNIPVADGFDPGDFADEPIAQ